MADCDATNLAIHNNDWDMANTGRFVKLRNDCCKRICNHIWQPVAVGTQFELPRDVHQTVFYNLPFKSIENADHLSR